MSQIQIDVSQLMDRLPAGVVVHARDTRIVYANSRALSSQLAERLRSRAAELRVGTDLLNFTLSAGIATDSLAQDLSGTLIASDAALYRAKASGRNCVQLFK